MKTNFAKLTLTPETTITVYGEAYGGKQQGMSGTYGKVLKFAAFDVKVDERWLTVPDAEQMVLGLGLEFVFYKQVSTVLAALDAERDADSVQAIRNGVGPGKMREGVVLRPLIEVTMNSGARICAKHKRAEFSETRTPREVTGKEIGVMEEALSIAQEWVTVNRLKNVLSHMPHGIGMEATGDVIKAMIADVTAESAPEIEITSGVRRAIGTLTANMYKHWVTAESRKAIEEVGDVLFSGIPSMPRGKDLEGINLLI